MLKEIRHVLEMYLNLISIGKFDKTWMINWCKQIKTRSMGHGCCSL